MRLYRISEKKPLIIAQYGVSRETRCLKVVRGLLQLAGFVYARTSKALAKSCIQAGLSEPSSHANVIRTMIISSADQLIVLMFSLQTIYFIFLFSIII